MTRFEIISLAWSVILIIGLLNVAVINSLIVDLICAIFSFLLTIFYFYGSFFYFLNIPLNNKLIQNIKALGNSERILGFLLGLPFILLSLSLGFLLLRFPGAQIFTAISVLLFLMITFVYWPSIKNSLEQEKRTFLLQNFKLYLYILGLVIILILLTWEENPIVFKMQIGPSNAPRY